MTLFKDHYLKKLNDAITSCYGCSLKKFNCGPLFGRGSMSADVMLVLEIPDCEEVTSGNPFTGRVKENYAKFLEASGLTTDEYYATYFMKCARGMDMPDESDFLKCKKFFLQEMEIIRPKIVMTMGHYCSKYIIEHFSDEMEYCGLEKIHGNGIMVPGIIKRKKIIREKFYIVPTYNLISSDPVVVKYIMEDVMTISTIKKLSTVLFC